jgi:hypothetical protein
MEQRIDLRHRSMMIIWFALLMSIVMYFGLTLVAGVKINVSQTTSEAWVIVALTALAMILIIVSFIAKQKFLRRSVDEHNVGLVQQGYVLAWALCEASALFGLLECFAFGYRRYYALMLLGAIGIGIQFPRREHILAAAFENKI